MIDRNKIIKIVAFSVILSFLVSESIAVNLGAQTSNNSTKYLSENALSYNQIPKELTKQIPNRYQHVNPFSLYLKEPAPMGITDYGIAQNGQPYDYKTTSFLGNITVNRLETYNSSLNQSANYAGFQLNVNIIFYNGNSFYVYWIQDVVQIDTADNYVMFIDNIWNMSSSGASMYNSTVLGNGTVGSSGGTGYYYDLANQYLPGNDMYLPYTYNIQLKVYSYVNSKGYPAVSFLYNDGHGWITYDNANFIFASYLTSSPMFLVDGYQYEPTGYTFYDAELILGGPGGGTQTYNNFSSLNLTLEYWNGHNYQAITNAYNFGSNTAEGISNVISSAMYYRENGSLFENVLNGSGQLAQVYTQSDIAVINISSSLSSGYLMVNNSRYDFIDGDVNITIAPGTYSFSLYSLSGLLIREWNEVIYAGEYLALSALSIYQVSFLESGLPTGTTWYVNLSNGQSFTGTGTAITFDETNGTYSYTIATVNSNYALNASSGTFTINGANLNIAVTFYLVSYKVTFVESGLPSGTSWHVTLNGITHNSTTVAITFNVSNGSYSYTIETPISGATGTQYVVLQFSGTVTVSGTSKNINAPYIKQYYLTITSSPPDGGRVSPSSGWYNSGSSLTTEATANSSFEFVSWTGTGNGGYSGTSNPASITIDGPVTEGANFIKLYQITFMEAGLPSGTLWYLNLSDDQSYSSTTNMITLKEPNGSYAYSIATANKEYAATGGSFVINGVNMEMNVKFTIVTYTITFTESGLASGTSWSVTLSNVTRTSTNGTIIFSQPNGTYSYVITGIPGYRANAYSGTIYVNGNSVSNAVTWTLVTYPITIAESGISNGTAWSATITGTTFNGQYINVTLTSTTGTITFNEPNGTYSYATRLPSGFTGNMKGSVTVSGQPVTSRVNAEPVSSYNNIELIAAIVVIIAVIGAVVGIIIHRTDRRRS
jgi:hypothetical protein